MAFLGALAPLLTTIGAGVSIATGIKSLVSKPKAAASQPAPAPTPQAAPAVPTVEDAAIKAQEEAKKRRRISFLSGGNTDITRGQALVPESAIGKKSLIGV